MTKFNKAACSMQKKKESLAAKKSEAAGQDMQLHLWFPRYSNASKKVYLYVVKPSDFEGWYDVSNEYHDAYEKNAELRNGDVDYEKVRYDVMKQILSGAVKPCEDPMNSHRNFTSLFDSRPYVITQYKQDSLDSKYSECKSEAKKPTCSMQKKKESLAKKNEDNSKEYVTEWQADIIKGLEKVKDKYGLVIEYNGPFSDQWKEYPTYTVFVRKGGKKEDVGTVGTDYVHAYVDYINPGMNVSKPHKAKDYSAEEAIQVILNSANLCLGKKGESKNRTCSMQKKKESLAKKCEGLMDDLPYDAPVAIESLCAEIMSHSEEFTIEDADVAEMCGKWYIRDYANGPTAAQNEDEFVDEVLAGLSGSPVDGSPFGSAEAEEYARKIYNEVVA